MSNQNVVEQVKAILDNVFDSNTVVAIKILIDLKLESIKESELDKFLEQANELKRNYGIETETLTNVLSSSRGKGLKVTTKYRSKTNPTDSWTGRGKQPKWVNAYLNENPSNKLDDLLTVKPPAPEPAKAETQPAKAVQQHAKK